MRCLTEKQSAVLATIRRYIETNGYAPTIREIAAELGVSGSAPVVHLRALERKGYLNPNKLGSARTMTLTGKAE